jgi:hypothetical protein
MILFLAQMFSIPTTAMIHCDARTFLAELSLSSLTKKIFYVDLYPFSKGLGPAPFLEKFRLH